MTFESVYSYEVSGMCMCGCMDVCVCVYVCVCMSACVHVCDSRITCIHPSPFLLEVSVCGAPTSIACLHCQCYTVDMIVFQCGRGGGGLGEERLDKANLS